MPFGLLITPRSSRTDWKTKFQMMLVQRKSHYREIQKLDPRMLQPQKAKQGLGIVFQSLTKSTVKASSDVTTFQHTDVSHYHKKPTALMRQ